jgi:SAM-dependent methyltransferase
MLMDFSSDLGHTLIFQPFLILQSPSSFRSKWFERFYAFLGPRFASSPVQISYIEFVISQAHGIVLEIGPGSGEQTFHFKANKIEKIYGVEPNEHFHPALIAKAKEAGMDGKYIPIKAAAQPGSLFPALKDAGLLPRNMASLPEGGVFDSIVMIKSMCSVPHFQLPETMEVMRALLKPNGPLLFFEHLQNDTSFFSQCYGGFLSLFLWPALMGGCRLDGKLDKVVMGMTGWKSKEIENIREFKGHEVLRYATGVCTKA